MFVYSKDQLSLVYFITVTETTTKHIKGKPQPLYKEVQFAGEKMMQVFFNKSCTLLSD